ncbi:hypothetical protein AMTRI_Chr02g214420 [Amborella trichopoda]
MGSAQFVLLLVWALIFWGCGECLRPPSVTIGAVFTLNSTIGRVAKVAVETAVDDINANSKILGGTKLKLFMEDSNCSGFLGTVNEFQKFLQKEKLYELWRPVEELLVREAVAVIGPQSSTIAHMLCHVADELQVPVLSFGATDPTLSALQYPFFLRTTYSDSYQMAAVADIIDYFGWKEVIAIFIDDDYGRNGVAALDDELAKNLARISYKAPLPIGASRKTITDLLVGLKGKEQRIYIVHASPDSGLKIFSTAKYLKMMKSGYVWIATDWLCTSLDSSGLSNSYSLSPIQGVIGLCQHTPESEKKKSFVSRWSNFLNSGRASTRLNAYGLFAYDTVWMVAHALNEFFNGGENISFSDIHIRDIRESKLHLASLKRFDGGHSLLKKLLQMNFTGLAGQIWFSTDKNLVLPAYDIINVGERTVRRIGYWSNSSGLSETPYEKPRETVFGKPKLGSVIWPGNTTQKPRGWVFPENGERLRIVVPWRTSYTEFVRKVDGTGKIEGYCIDVFTAALKLIPYAVPHMFVAYGNGQANPNYDDLVKLVSEKKYDAAVGDIAIVTNRTTIVDFTQPYAASGLVIVVPVKNTKSNAWVFLKPFTPEMWCATGAFFLFIGAVVWFLEHRTNTDFRGPPKQQLVTMFLFSFSTLFNAQTEKTGSPLARFVMIVWLFLVLVITSSYTASLTSILTVQQLAPAIMGIESLIASHERIAYQVGSFTKRYLTEELNIPSSRLISLKTPEAYAQALRLGPTNGGVAAIVDELPYVEMFLSNRSEFGIVGQMFTKRGWGFAFPRDSVLAVDMSTAILGLSENGELQRIHENWFCKNKAGCRESNSQPQADQLHMRSFWGLFLLCGFASLVALFIFLLQTVRQYRRYGHQVDSSSESEPSSVSCNQSVHNFLSFVDLKEEEVKSKLKRQSGTLPSQVKSEASPSQVKSEASPSQAKSEALPSQVKSEASPSQVKSEASPSQVKSDSSPSREN